MSLLGEEWAGAMLGLLSQEDCTAEEIEERLGGRLERSPRRALRDLTQMGLVASVPGNRFPARTPYALEPPGRDLLETIEALETWRGSWTPAHPEDAGLRRLVTRPEARLVGRALVEGPLPFRDLQRRIPGLSAGTLHRVLGRLRESGVVRVDPRSPSNHPLYELGEPGRRLGRVIVLGARWRWRWAADRASPDAGDLPGLVHLLAPLAKVPRPLEGTCRLTILPPSHWPDGEPFAAWARVSGGRLVALALRPVLGGVQVRMSAPPQAWCDALLAGRTDGVEVAGDAALASGVVAALADAIAR